MCVPRRNAIHIELPSSGWAVFLILHCRKRQGMNLALHGFFFASNAMYGKLCQCYRRHRVPPTNKQVESTYDSATLGNADLAAFKWTAPHLVAFHTPG